MGHLIGHGRYAREVYPISKTSGGGTASIVPMERQKFIDGDTAQPGENGSASDPFPSIASFLASRVAASPADAVANYVGWLMPAIEGYVEDIDLPPYVSIELRADSLSFSEQPGSRGVVVTGDLTWNNVAGPVAADPAAVVNLHNISLTGSLTVTDDAGAPQSLLGVSSDAFAYTNILGGIVSNTTTKLGLILLQNVGISGGIDAGVAAESAGVIAVNSSIANGPLHARSILAVDSQISAPTIQTAPGFACEFRNCKFSNTPVLTNLGDGALFDGPSWQSFEQAEGTRAAGTSIRVVGGYNGGGVVGAPLTAAATDVSLNGAGASVSHQGENSGNHYSTAAAGVNTVTILNGGGELNGDTMLITKPGFGNALEVQNNAGNPIATIPDGHQGFVLARYNGAIFDWVLEECGSLPEPV